MSWDSFREIEKLMDSYRQMEDLIRQTGKAFEAEELYGLGHGTRRLLIDHSAAHRALQETLAAAFRPFPDIAGLVAPPVDLTGLLGLFSGVNAAIHNAPLLGEIDFQEEDDEEPEHLSQEERTRRTEAKLVQVVPAEALGALRRVEFAPVVFLDQAVRNPELMRLLSARDFEAFVAELVQGLGFSDVQLTRHSRDGGRDILATKRIHGISILFAFECKRYRPDRSIEPTIARALLGSIHHPETRATKGVLVTTSFFSPATRRFILTEPSLDGKDFDGIVEWLREYGGKKTG